MNRVDLTTPFHKAIGHSPRLIYITRPSGAWQVNHAAALPRVIPGMFQINASPLHEKVPDVAGLAENDTLSLLTVALARASTIA